jgi:hypothetical protein
VIVPPPAGATTIAHSGEEIWAAVGATIAESPSPSSIEVPEAPDVPSVEAIQASVEGALAETVPEEDE